MLASSIASVTPCTLHGRRCVNLQVTRAELSSSPIQPTAPTPPRPNVPKAAPPPAEVSKGVTIEFQRAQAKEMVAYFKSLSELKSIENAKVFGWTPANEINNGRWVMMGVFIGLLTEYATGVDFVHQLILMVGYLGLADLD